MIVRAESDDDIIATYGVMRQLRPAFTQEEYLVAVRALMRSDDYRLVSLVDDGAVRAVAGYRFLTMLYCGRILSVDDFVTDEHVRSRGYGTALLDWLRAEGRAADCAELQLISRVTREAAHRFYFRRGLGIECFHFRERL